jgi:hypothetical protein
LPDSQSAQAEASDVNPEPLRPNDPKGQSVHELAAVVSEYPPLEHDTHFGREPVDQYHE